MTRKQRLVLFLVWGIVSQFAVWVPNWEFGIVIHGLNLLWFMKKGLDALCKLVGGQQQDDETQAAISTE